MTLIFVIVSVISLVAFFVTFDELIRREHKRHRTHWEKDGRPRGVFWFGRDTRLGAGNRARTKLLYRWLVLTPEWARNDPQAFNLLLVFRVSWCLLTSLLAVPIVKALVEDIFR